MEAVICLDKNDITTQWMGNNLAIRLASALNVMITLTPEAVDELISDIAKLKEQRVKAEARRIFNVARRDLGMSELTEEELTEEELTEAMSKALGRVRMPRGPESTEDYVNAVQDIQSSPSDVLGIEVEV